MSWMPARKRAQIGSKPGECGMTDGMAICTNPEGHGPSHWDRHMQHEWSDDDDA